MKSFFRPALIGFLVLGAALTAPAFDQTEQGIRVAVGQTHVDLAAVRPGIFRLSFSFDGEPKPAASIFLGGLAKDAPSEKWGSRYGRQ